MGMAKDQYHNEICANAYDENREADDIMRSQHDNYIPVFERTEQQSVNRVANRLFASWAVAFKDGNGLVDWYRDGLMMAEELNNEPIHAKAA